MFMFDSETIRSKSKLRFCFWTVSNWESTVLLLCLYFEFTSYYNLHHKYICIKCFCCFELRKVQKHIYCQRRWQFNRFQNRVCCVQWSECRCSIIPLNIFEDLSFIDRMITAFNYNVFLDYIILILIIYNNIMNDKNVNLMRSMSKTKFNHDHRR